MGRTFALFVTLFACMAPASAAELEPTPTNLAIGHYYRCVIDYSMRFVKTPERPSDVGQAALSYCQSLREDVRAAMSASPQGKHLSYSDVTAALIALEKNAERAASVEILAARYPNLAPQADEAAHH